MDRREKITWSSLFLVYSAAVAVPDGWPDYVEWALWVVGCTLGVVELIRKYRR